MKKKGLKNFKLNKKSVSNLNQLQGGQEQNTTAPDDGSWYYCHSQGMGCYLRTKIFDDCPNQPSPPDPDHTRDCPSWNVAC